MYTCYFGTQRGFHDVNAQVNPFRCEHQPCPVPSVGNGIKPVLIFDLPVAGRRCACPTYLQHSLFAFLPLKSRPPLAISFPPALLGGNSYLRICHRSLNGQDLYRRCRAELSRVLCLTNKDRSCIWAIRYRSDEFNDPAHGNSRKGGYFISDNFGLVANVWQLVDKLR